LVLDGLDDQLGHGIGSLLLDSWDGRELIRHGRGNVGGQSLLSEFEFVVVESLHLVDVPGLGLLLQQVVSGVLSPVEWIVVGLDSNGAEVDNK
jgi:hypothetical protein